MATVIAEMRLMANDNMRSTDLAVAVRIATRILPPHRKDWAAAMLNEAAYVGSRRAAWFWVLGCALFAIRERASFELARTFMTRRILRALLRLSAASVIAVIGLYMLQKPYQRERILIAVFHSAQASAARHSATAR
jgi:hypothetical protein